MILSVNTTNVVSVNTNSDSNINPIILCCLFVITICFSKDKLGALQPPILLKIKGMFQLIQTTVR